MENPEHGKTFDVRLTEVFRAEYARVVASVLRITRSIDEAEEVVQEAFVQALAHWPGEGLPERPGAWLLTTARRRALDRLRGARRAESGARAWETLLGPVDEASDMLEPESIPDDRLRLIFTCCHPVLSPESRVALTLRLVGGLSTVEIARAFLVPEPTIAQRLVRAKRTIREQDVGYDVPDGPERTARLPAVLAVVYLIFNEGYAAHTGDTLVREDLCNEAIRLGRMLAELMPATSEVLGLIALMELQASRAAARSDADGNVVLLEHQDRARWSSTLIADGLRHLAMGGPMAAAGFYQLQAAIAACHARAVSWGATDWPEIVALYDRLIAIVPSPVIALNRSAAVAMADGPAAGLAALDAADLRGLGAYHLLPAARADCLRRLGRHAEAAMQYRAALDLADNARERAFLSARLAECAGASTIP